MIALTASYDSCRKIARQRARNFYYSFLLLPKPQRDGMCAIYAFMRYCDDLSDDPSESDLVRIRQSLIGWRAALDRALAGQPDNDPLWPAFLDTVARYRIPHHYFHGMIDGVSSDLERRSMRTFDELYRYCYQVASVVGLTIIHIFGFQSPKALELAEKCGIAFQLTNILRDVREDAELGRVYLPAEDLERFGVLPAGLTASAEAPEFQRLMRYQADRARRYYDEAMPLVGMVHRRSQSSLWAMIEIYSRLLKRIEQTGFDVLRQRVRLSSWEKIGILVQAKMKTSRGFVAAQ